MSKRERTYGMIAKHDWLSLREDELKEKAANSAEQARDLPLVNCILSGSYRLGQIYYE